MSGKHQNEGGIFARETRRKPPFRASTSKLRLGPVEIPQGYHLSKLRMGGKRLPNSAGFRCLLG